MSLIPESLKIYQIAYPADNINAGAAIAAHLLSPGLGIEAAPEEITKNWGKLRP